ncbi:MAG: hypothetical protein AAFX80_21495 [Cyanobacteria bacterium J06639_18]
MINLTSVENFLKTLPQPSLGVSKSLDINIKTFDENAIQSILLGHRGYLGCVTFANSGSDAIALRLLPEKQLSFCPVFIAWDYVTEGMTIASQLDCWIATRLAQMDIANPEKIPNHKIREELLDFAINFGDIETVNSIFQILDEASSIEDSFHRQAILWSAIDDNDSLYKVLSASRSLQDEEITQWSKNAIHTIPKDDIVWRIYLASQLRNSTDEDISKAAIRLILGDDVFDSTYTGYTYGPSIAAWENEPLVLAVKWLQENPNLTTNIEYPQIWEAAQQYAQSPLEYDGSAHLEAARKIESINPKLAYTHVSNAAAFFARSTEEIPLEAIEFSHQLAAKCQWKDLEYILNLTLENLDIDD